MAKDPYKYYRVEAAELLDNLTRGVLELEKGAADPAMVASLFRLAHTLKGASQVVRQPGIAQAAHALEDILSPLREGGPPVTRQQTSQVLGWLDQIGAQLAALEAPAPAGVAGTAAPPATADPLETVRVEVEEVENLLASVSEASVDLTDIQKLIEPADRARQLADWIVQRLGASGRAPDSSARMLSVGEELRSSLVRIQRGLSSSVERLERELTRSRERASRLRLLPAGAIFASLARLARDAAGTLGKQVELRTTGGEIRLDAQVLTVLRDALLQLVRNAVAHGIESGEARAAAGKPPMGRIEIDVRRAAGRVTFTCIDDGRGIDLAAIRRAAAKKGVISQLEAESLGLKEAIDLILKGGVSTATVVTGVSGRGIGLDVVRDAAARLKGEVSVATTSGRGTTVAIRVPVSLTSVTALLVQAGGMSVALPLDSVRQVLSLAGAGIARSGGGESVVYEASAIPFLAVSDVLNRAVHAANGRERKTALIVTAGASMAAVGVEKILGIETVLVRSLPVVASAEAVVAGGCLDAEGNPLLVLDPAGLVDAAHRFRARPETSAGSGRTPILVIDDSLTTRMVEQTLLESAGHLVDCATSAEEALEKAHARRYGLFLVDVEMPGMDGFQFIARAHDDPLLSSIPSILVSSRNSPEDHRHGEQVGANAYICKSEFDQGQFLETIRRLLEPALAG
jgi:two-component system, chemotaxis family, sensor kinase CheA